MIKRILSDDNYILDNLNKPHFDRDEVLMLTIHKPHRVSTFL